jgi:hypothetical protein
MRVASPSAAMRTARTCPIFWPLRALLSLALLSASLTLAKEPGSQTSIYHKRGLDINLGLSANNLDKNGISLGALLCSPPLLSCRTCRRGCGSLIRGADCGCPRLLLIFTRFPASMVRVLRPSPRARSAISSLLRLTFYMLPYLGPHHA